MASQIETAGKNAILESGVDATCLYLGLIYFDGVSMSSPHREEIKL